MGRIYAESELVIIAAAGSSSNYGLPGVSTRPRQAQKSVELGNNVEMIRMLDVDSALASSTWATRGWTLQEGYLAARRLVFTDNEVFYVCDRGVWQESVQSPTMEENASYYVLNDNSFPRSMPQDIAISALLSHYLTRRLSFEGDILNACIGSLEKLVGRHFWGITTLRSSITSRYELTLEWHSHSPGERREGFPPWSWAATTGSKFIPSQWTIAPQNFIAHIRTTDGRWLSPEEQTKSLYDMLPAHFGPTLRLTGPFYPAALLRVKPIEPDIHDGDPARKVFVRFRYASGNPDHIGIGLELLPDIRITDSDLENTVKAVLLVAMRNSKSGWNFTFMIVQAVDDHYRRIGVTDGRCSWILDKKGQIKKHDMGFPAPEPIPRENVETETIYIE